MNLLLFVVFSLPTIFCIIPANTRNILRIFVGFVCVHLYMQFNSYSQMCLFWHHQFLKTLCDFCTCNDIPFLHVTKEICAFHDISKARIPPIQNILPSRSQITIKQQPEKLTTSAIRIILLPRPSHGSITRKRQNGSLTPPPLILHGALIKRCLIPHHRNLARYEPLPVRTGSDRLRCLRHVSIRLSIGITSLHHESIASLDRHVGVKPFVD
mmetsp:Transcript_14629/g.21609  ORF Transcript_14629/g.21609 Transcript_14629/m.21609 type:complete len:212 (+) Transcript_14629:154-789(+)